MKNQFLWFYCIRIHIHLSLQA